MRRGLKRDRALAETSVPEAPFALLAPPPAPGGRWFEALDPEAAPAPPRRELSAKLAIPLFALALLALLFVKTAALRFALPLSLTAAASLVLVRARRGGPDGSSGARSIARRGLEIAADRLSFRGGGRTQSLLSTATPFGVTLLAAPRRDRVVAMLSSVSGTFYVGARFDAAARRASAALLDRATLLGGDDIGLEAIGPDGAPLLLSPGDLGALVDALDRASPACLERFVLTDARGAELALDGRELRLAGRAVDLTAPVEWRAIVFQEAFGQAVAVYQGTWIRQGATELTLVCLLPSIGPAAGAELDAGALDRAALRDLRLMQATPDAPPPTEQRVAIDRLFMIPVRSALDHAPRPSQQPPTRARA